MFHVKHEGPLAEKPCTRCYAVTNATATETAIDAKTSLN